MMYRNNLLPAFMALLALFPAALRAEDIPVAVDSRIRTLVYSANEVFRMYTAYGYQSSIEFSEDEQITTISLGSSSAFKITPSGNRLFIKALQRGRHTNMTVLTTERAYQFELFSDEESEDRVIYVMRFYYPEENFDDATAGAPPQGTAPAAPPPVNPPAPDILPAAATPPQPMPLPEAPLPPQAAPSPQPENYNYSLTGPEYLSPLSVYDNGLVTFFKFPPGVNPMLLGVNPDGTEYPVPSHTEGDHIVVNAVLKRFSVRSGSEVVCVFNDAAPAPGMVPAPAAPFMTR